MPQPLPEDLACPFCGLACDDLRIEVRPDGLAASGGACARAQSAYRRVGASVADRPTAWIGGQAAALDAAIDHAATLIAGARRPLFAGLATDVLGMRGLMDLADERGALLDHMNAESKLRNLRTVQDQGWITTTLSEVRNRADLVVCFGSLAPGFPRFFERCVWVEDTLFAPDVEARQVVYIGPPVDLAAACSPAGRAPEWIDIPQARLAEAAALLRGLAADSLPASTAASSDLPVAALQALVTRLRAAHYGVIVWAAADLDWSNADLSIQALAGMIDTLNRATRCAGLPLGGSDGDFSADAVMLWQTGYPFRTSLASGTGHYDPVGQSTERVLAAGEADLLLWVSSFDPDRHPPPAGDCPVIALCCGGTPPLEGVAVQITVSTPGVDDAGYMFRADKVVTLPLRASMDRQLPSVAALARRWMTGQGAQAC